MQNRQVLNVLAYEPPTWGDTELRMLDAAAELITTRGIDGLSVTVLAKAAGVAVIATGRSDFPNQVNNAIAFPGIFRGALDHGVKQITDEHKLAAAEALARLVEHPTADEIIPSPFDERVVPAVAAVIVP